MRQMRRWLAILGSIGALSAVVIPLACSVAVDLDGLSGGKPPVDAGTDAADAAPAPVCTHARWPDPPASAMEGGTEDFYAAVRSIDLGENKPEGVGLDLDGLCTCETDGPSCIYPSYAMKDHCDASGGRDNALGKVFREVESFAGAGATGSTVFSSKAEIGAWSLIVRVSQYNGQPDDAQVTVSLYGTGWDKDGGKKEPAWDGSDTWRISKQSLTDGTSFDSPKFVDTAAYVTGGIVVASLTEAFLNISGGDGALGIRLTAGTLSGRIEETPMGYRVRDGVIAARWKTEDIFSVIGTFKVAGQTLCNDGGLAYTTFKQLICGNIDIASKIGGATTPCDSLSFGMTFSTEPIKVAGLYEPDPADSPCKKATDPANDSCDK